MRTGNRMIRRHLTAVAAAVFALAVSFAPMQAQQPAPLRVPRAVLERYVGEYDQEGTIIRITLNGDTLFREVPGQRVIMAPMTENKFRIGGVFTAEFVSDASG